jgi:flavin reductase (DIM6/NTAB) family NADH-FMN oxidoreductase RutF
MTVSADLFREVFRRWPSGVAVLTSREGDKAHGMVVGSFCSLSSEPPLVMVSAGRTSRSHDLIDGSGVFTVSILSSAQTGIFERFAGIDRTFDDDRFAQLETVPAPESGLPIFPEALAWVDCRVQARHPGESYTIFVGEVLAASLGASSEDSPLLYFRRQPGTLVAKGS